MLCRRNVCNFLSNKSVEILFESESFWIGKCREKKIYSECVLLSKRWYTLVVQMKQQARSVEVVRLLAPLQQFVVSNSLRPFFFQPNVFTANTDGWDPADNYCWSAFVQSKKNKGVFVEKTSRALGTDNGPLLHWHCHVGSKYIHVREIWPYLHTRTSLMTRNTYFASSCTKLIVARKL